jgi:peptidoglycan DL-endopeptidase CwlO
MGFMDKAKEAALQAKATAQHAAQQGQAKVASVQQSRSEAELYRALGEAFFNEQRRGADAEAVRVALAALDEHFSALASAGSPPAGGPAPSNPAPSNPAPSGPAPSEPAVAPPPSAPAAPPPAGNFTLDDV